MLIKLRVTMWFSVDSRPLSRQIIRNFHATNSSSRKLRSKGIRMLRDTSTSWSKELKRARKHQWPTLTLQDRGTNIVRKELPSQKLTREKGQKVLVIWKRKLAMRAQLRPSSMSYRDNLIKWGWRMVFRDKRKNNTYLWDRWMKMQMSTTLYLSMSV